MGGMGGVVAGWLVPGSARHAFLWALVVTSVVQAAVLWVLWARFPAEPYTSSWRPKMFLDQKSLRPLARLDDSGAPGFWVPWDGARDVLGGLLDRTLLLRALAAQPGVADLAGPGGDPGWTFPWYTQLISWDGMQYLMIAIHGYVQEHTHAFFPLWAYVLRFLGERVLRVAVWLQVRALPNPYVLLTALHYSLVPVLRGGSAAALWILVCRRLGGSRATAAAVCLVHVVWNSMLVFTQGSIYTHAPFAVPVFWMLVLLSPRRAGPAGPSWRVRAPASHRAGAVLCAILAASMRPNGLALAGYFMVDAGRASVLLWLGPGAVTVSGLVTAVGTRLGLLARPRPPADQSPKPAEPTPRPAPRPVPGGRSGASLWSKAAAQLGYVAEAVVSVGAVLVPSVLVSLRLRHTYCYAPLPPHAPVAAQTLTVLAANWREREQYWPRPYCAASSGVLGLLAPYRHVQQLYWSNGFLKFFRAFNNHGRLGQTVLLALLVSIPAMAIAARVCGVLGWGAPRSWWWVAWARRRRMPHTAWLLGQDDLFSAALALYTVVLSWGGMLWMVAPTMPRMLLAASPLATLLMGTLLLDGFGPRADAWTWAMAMCLFVWIGLQLGAGLALHPTQIGDWN